MTKEEIQALMAKPPEAKWVNEYQQIHILATGHTFRKCFCGNGWENFINICKKYAANLK